MRPAESDTDLRQLVPGDLGHAHTVVKAGSGAADAEQSRPLAAQQIEKLLLGTRFGIAIENDALVAGPIEISGNARQPQRRHDIGGSRNIVTGGLGLVAEGM